MKNLIRNLLSPPTQHKKMPDFNNDSIIRCHILFTERVQGVGFRYEVTHIAQELNLTGWVRNKYNGDVEMEIQGSQSKIDYLLNQMHAITRINISDQIFERISLISEEGAFKIRNDTN